jgi:integrase
VLRDGRQSKLWPSHVRHQQKKRKSKPKRTKGDRYDVASYRRAIFRACDLAFPPPLALVKRREETRTQWQERLSPNQKTELATWRSDHRWHPHQLRHSAATNIRNEFGIELARIILGHSTAFTTEIYAETDRQQAIDVIAKMG